MDSWPGGRGQMERESRDQKASLIFVHIPLLCAQERWRKPFLNEGPVGWDR